MQDLLELIPSDQKLQALAESKRFEYLVARPFSHIVLDHFLPLATANLALEAFPKPSSGLWKHYDNEHEKKGEANGDGVLPVPIRQILYALNSATFLRFLEKISFMGGLVGDPYFIGAGLHEISPGGWLDIHTDFNYHPKTRLYRVLNLLLFLNKGWEKDYGSDLELYGSEGDRCISSIEPIFNRCVIFGTTSKSFHGHPKPLRCPDHLSRKSIAVYYYSAHPPKGEPIEKRGTIWLRDVRWKPSGDGKSPRL